MSLQNGNSVNRSGVVMLLMLLVCIIIGMFIWAGPRYWVTRGDSDPELPWNLRSSLVGRDETPQKPSSAQLDMGEIMTLKAELKEDSASHGDISIIFARDGRISGGWGGEYKPEAGIIYEVLSAPFKGNIDPSRRYSDENGVDPSKLFFIAEGGVLMTKTVRAENKIRRIDAEIFVTGWIDADYNVIGEVIITSDRKSWKTFTWHGEL